MTLASELSTLADTVRKLTGIAEKLSLSDMTANLQKLIPPEKIVIMDDMAGKFNPEPRGAAYDVPLALSTKYPVLFGSSFTVSYEIYNSAHTPLSSQVYLMDSSDKALIKSTDVVEEFKEYQFDRVVPKWRTKISGTITVPANFDDFYNTTKLRVLVSSSTGTWVAARVWVES